MNDGRIALATLGTTVAYFAFGFILFAALPAMKSEFMMYPNLDRSAGWEPQSSMGSGPRA